MCVLKILNILLKKKKNKESYMKYKDLRGWTFGLCLGVTSKGKIYYENREIIKKEQKY